jgi:zinc protease
MEEFMTRFIPMTSGIIGILLVSFAALLFVRTDGAAQESKIFPYDINQETLDNGLKIVSIPFPSPGIIAYYTVVRTGSRNEVEPGLSGFAHFFEHMMFRGTEKYDKDKYNDILKEMGADNNAFTSDDVTAYHTLASSAALETIMDMEADRFMNLKYSVEDFKTEAGAILGEYNKNYSSPFMIMYEKLNEAAYEKHTYKHTTMGFLKDILDMPNQYDYSIKFFDRWYRPENCVVVVVGDFNQTKLIELAKKYYSNWKRGSYTLQVPVEPPQKKEKIVNLTWKSKTLPMLAIGYHGAAFSTTDIDMPTLDIISQLVFSQTSPLYNKLVIDKQWVEFIQGGQGDSRDAGLFSIWTRIKDTKNIEAVRNEIYAALEEIKNNPVSAEKLSTIKSYLKYSFAMSLDNADAVAGKISHYIQLTGDPESINQVYALYDKVTPEDITRVAKKYFTKENRTVVNLIEEGSK